MRFIFSTNYKCTYFVTFINQNGEAISVTCFSLFELLFRVDTKIVPKVLCGIMFSTNS